MLSPGRNYFAAQWEDQRPAWAFSWLSLHHALDDAHLQQPLLVIRPLSHRKSLNLYKVFINISCSGYDLSEETEIPDQWKVAPLDHPLRSIMKHRNTPFSFANGRKHQEEMPLLSVCRVIISISPARIETAGMSPFVRILHSPSFIWAFCAFYNFLTALCLLLLFAASILPSWYTLVVSASEFCHFRSLSSLAEQAWQGLATVAWFRSLA